MKNKIFNLPSGAALLVNTASFEKAVALNDAILKDLLKTGNTTVEVSKLEMATVISLSSSAAVRDAVFACANRRVTYHAAGKDDAAHFVEPAMFDDEKIGDQARSDYFNITQCVIEMNFSPFYPTRSSGLETAAQTIAKAPPLK